MKRWTLIFGLLTGAFLAWIFAPEKGRDLRKKMQKDRADGKLGLAPLTRDMGAALSSAASSAYDLYKSKKVKELAQKGEDTLKEIGGQVARHFKDEIDLVRALYEKSNPEKLVHFEKHHMVEGNIATKKATTKAKSTRRASTATRSVKAAKRKAAAPKGKAKSQKERSK